MKLIFIVLLAVFSLGFSFAALAPSFPANIAYAQQGGVDGGLGDISPAFPDGAKEEVNVQAVAKRIIDWALYLAGILAVLFIIYGGFLYITSGGDAGQAGKGKTTLVNALIGLVIVVLSYMIVQTVYNFLVDR